MEQYEIGPETCGFLIFNCNCIFRIAQLGRKTMDLATLVLINLGPLFGSLLHVRQKWREGMGELLTPNGQRTPLGEARQE